MIVKKLGVAEVNVLDTIYIFLKYGKPESVTIRKKADIFYPVFNGFGFGEVINVGYSADEKMINNIYKVQELKHVSRKQDEMSAEKEIAPVGKFMIRHISSLANSIKEKEVIINFNGGAVLYNKKYIADSGASDQLLKNVIIDKNTAESIYLSECDIVLWKDPLAQVLRTPVL